MKLRILDFGLRNLDFVSGRADRGDHDRRDFGGFLDEGGELCFGKKVSLGDHREPKTRFIGFFLHGPELGGKFRFAATSTYRPIVCGHAGRATPKLPAQNICRDPYWQCVHDIQTTIRKPLCPLFQLAFIHSTASKQKAHNFAKFPNSQFQNPRSKIQNPKLSAFTLVELLVAMAVLSLVLVLMTQVVDGIMQSTRTQNQQMEAVASARRAVDVLALDLKHALVNRSASILVPSTPNSQTRLLFFTERRGPQGPQTAGDHRFLAIAYDFDAATAELRRKYRSIAITDRIDFGTLTSGPWSSTTFPTASGIWALDLRVVDENGDSHSLNPVTPEDNWATDTYNEIATPAGFSALISPGPDFAANLTNRARMVEVWMAASDEQVSSIIEETSSRASLQAALGDDPALWRENIDAAENLPGPVKSGVRIIQKNIPLP